jgi:hypothetical protein
MHISRLFVGLCAVALLSACDGRSPTPTPTPFASSGVPRGTRPTAAAVDPAGVFVQVAQCFRAHGHPDFPDPVQRADGAWEFPATAGRVKVPAECADLVLQLKQAAPGSSSAPDLAGPQAFARCMRANGVPDWPDPGADGTFAVPERLADPRNEGLWKPRADGPCAQYQPKGGPDIVVAAPR